MDTRGIIVRMYKEEYYALLYIQYKSSRAHDFREIFLCLFPNVRICNNMTTKCAAIDHTVSSEILARILFRECSFSK